jgi:hypothetical protein
VAAVLDLSAETGRLAVTPAPYGKPGGPGLYGVHGLKHSDYLEQIVKALMRKGMDKGKATAIARGSIRKWMAKSKHPEVRAAAGLAEAEELKAQARAHAHAATWDDLASVLDLAAAPPPDAHQQHIAHLQHLATHGTPAQQAAAKTLLAGSAKSATASAQPRVAAGAPAGGQFAVPGGGSAPAKSTAKAPAAKAPAAAKAKTTAKPAAAKAAPAKTAAPKTASASAKAAAHKAHLAHVAHLQHLATHGSPAQQKAARAVLARMGVKP